MKVLLDTHIVLWALADDPRLKPRHRALFNDDQQDLFVSAVTIWEIAIKRALGKLIAPDGLQEILLAAGCHPLPISWRHAEAAGALPLIHADPFDRLLIAQSSVEQLAFATMDAQMSEYDVEVL